MGNFNRDNRSSGRRDFRRRDFGQRGGDRQMHRAVCSNCGKECEVPFRPSGDKPVYCNTCFEKNNRGTDSRKFGDRNYGKSSFEDRESKQPQYNEQFNKLNAKLDKILAMKGPVLIDVLLSDTQKLIPKLVAVRSDDGQRYISKPIEDMVPLLSREEFYANMIVKPLEEGDKDKSSEIN